MFRCHLRALESHTFVREIYAHITRAIITIDDHSYKYNVCLEIMETSWVK